MRSQESLSSELVRSQLVKVLAADGFARNDRLSGFLRYVVEHELSGHGPELKESIIGVEVFGRRPGYDVRQDSGVRTEAIKLRARLLEYYANEGAADPLIIELPKGTYRPAFRKTQATGPRAPESRRPQLGVAVWLGIGILALGLAALAWWRLERQNAPIPIAVLPLVNLRQDPANDYFADGLTEELIRNLSILDGLAVRSQTSSFAFKGKQRDVHEAGRQLQADYILEGAVLRSGQQLRINAQLVRVRDDFPVWSAKYDRELTDIFAIQEEISRGIINSLRLKLGRGRRRYETSVEAYDLYLRARTLPVLRQRPRIAAFEQTIAKDPSFAPAYAGLSTAHAYLTDYDRFNTEQRAEERSQMRSAAEKALQLDPLLPEAHSALGDAYAREAQWDRSEKSFRRALELDPNSSFVRAEFADNLLLPLGRIDEAIKQIRLAEKSDPLSAIVRDQLANALFTAGRFKEAMEHCQKPCIEGLLLQGKTREAIPVLEARFRQDLSAPGSETLGVAYALAGRREDAEKVATIQWRPFGQAQIFTALGDKDRAFAALERTIPLGPVRIGRELNYPELIPLRGDPRVKALRKKVGLPE
jgi:TolB-like protein